METRGAAWQRGSASVGARPFDGLVSSDAEALGDEVRELAALSEAGVPLAPGWVISLDQPVDAVVTFLAAALATPPPPRRVLGHGAIGRGELEPRVVGLKLRPWFKTLTLSQRLESRWPAVPELVDSVAVRGTLERLWTELRSPSWTSSVAGHPGGVWLRALVCDDGPAGRACSVDPEDGDPSSVAVWLSDRSPWRIDRKTMRPLEEGHGALPRPVLERVADTVDRAQLALGRPVEIDWVLSGGRPVVARVRPVNVGWQFSEHSWRVVSLLWHDEGPIAPLSIDALDKALGEDDDVLDEVRVRRMFARAYRRVKDGRRWRGERRQSFGAATVRAARVISDVARPIAAARAFSRTLDQRLASFDRDDLSQLDDIELARALRERQRVVIEAYQLLERGRQATVAVLSALEAALGTIPADCVRGLGAIRRPRSRRRLDAKLAKIGAELGELSPDLDSTSAAQRRRFAELRRELSDRRPLGLDVRIQRYGASDESLREGIVAARDGRAARAEREQRQAIRRLMATARARPLGRGRAALARTLTILIERLALAKGSVAEGLAGANLRVRDAAIEIGRRLSERGLLDRPEDALYLYVSEIQDALSNEPGAYTARVRLRREEDDRWRAFDPPTRVSARRGTRRSML